MKKIVLLTVCCATVVAVSSCKSKKTAEQNPGLAAKEYVESIGKGDYDKFVNAIKCEFRADERGTRERGSGKRRARSEKATQLNAAALKTIHHPSVEERGGMKETSVVSENVSPDGKTANISLANTYNSGPAERIDMVLVNENNVWKIRLNDNREVWKTVTDDGDREVLKIKDRGNRDFVKTKDNADKEFVKEITRRNGQVEVIKVLDDGQRHREVIRAADEEAPVTDKAVETAGN